MSYNRKYDTGSSSEHEMDYFSISKPPFNKSKEKAWEEIISKVDSIDIKQIKENKRVSLNTKVFYGLAATLLILLGTVLMLRSYSTSEYCSNNEQLVFNLPDNSTVTLQSNSAITYYPFWWRFSRKVVLSGEASFNVQNGNEFVVSSPLGRTIVLGTSFNIFSRDYKYHVTCFTGSVKVISFSQQSVILNPDQRAEIIDGKIKVSKYFGEEDNNVPETEMFDFTSAPLSDVIKQIEVYYNVKISSSDDLRYSYTGLFSKQKSIEESLYVVCKPYGLTFVVLSEKKYHIIKN